MTETELYDILNAPRKTKRNIAVIKAQMKKLELMMLPQAIRYDKENIKSTPKDTMIIFAEKMERLNKKALNLEKTYLQQYEDVERLINRLDDKHKGVLTLKYLAGCSTEEIAKELSYSESYVHKLRKESIKILKRG